MKNTTPPVTQALTNSANGVADQLSALQSENARLTKERDELARLICDKLRNEDGAFADLFAQYLREIQRLRKHLDHKIIQLNGLREVAESEQDFHHAAAKERDDLKAKCVELEHDYKKAQGWANGQAKQLHDLREKLRSLEAEVRAGLAHWNQFQKAELDTNEKEAAFCAQNGDKFRWNYCTGKHSGLISCDIGLSELKKIDGAPASKEGK